LIITNCLNLLNKKNSKTSATELHQIDAPLLNIHELNSIFVSYYITKDFIPFDDPTYFDIEVNQFMFKVDSNGQSNVSYISLDKVNCSIYYNYFKINNFEKEFLQNNLHTGLCFDNSKYKELVIGGKFGTEYFSNIHYSLKKCTNKTNVNNNTLSNNKQQLICKSSEEIDLKLKGGYFELFYFNKNINLKNFYSPINDYLDNYFILLDPQTTKFVDLYFKTINLITDAGLIFETPFSQDSLMFDYYREQIETSINSDVVIDLYVNSSNNIIIYTRTYQKFQEFAASIGGLMEILFLIGNILTSVYNDHRMNEKMINSLFNIKEESDVENDKRDSKHYLERSSRNMFYLKSSGFTQKHFLENPIKNPLEINIANNINNNIFQSKLINEKLEIKENDSIYSYSKIPYKIPNQMDNVSFCNTPKLNDNKNLLKNSEIPNKKYRNDLNHINEKENVCINMNPDSMNSNNKFNQFQYSPPNSFLEMKKRNYGENEKPIINKEKFYSKNSLNMRKETKLENLYRNNFDFIKNLEQIRDNKKIINNNKITFGENNENLNIKNSNSIKDFSQHEKYKDKINLPIIDDVNYLNYLNKNIKLNFIEKIKTYNKENDRKYKLQWQEILLIHFCAFTKKFKRKKKLYDISLIKLSKYLDFLEIINHLQEFDKFKKIYFSKEQLGLFNVYTKPSISNEKADKFRTNKIEEKFKQKNDFYFNLFNIYNRYKMSKENDEKVIKLLENIDPKIKNIFEEVIRYESQL